MLRWLKDAVIKMPGFSRAYECVTRADLGFHGDAITRAFVRSTIQELGVGAFVETGTFRGDTTRFVARSFPHLAVHSCEVNDRIFARAARRWRRDRNVRRYD